MSEAAEKLEARVNRAIAAANGDDSRERKLELSCKWLQDRLAISVGTSIRAQMRAQADECEALADIYSDGANFLLEDTPKWMARREELRGNVAYERAVIRIREALAAHIKGNGS